MHRKRIGGKKWKNTPLKKVFVCWFFTHLHHLQIDVISPWWQGFPKFDGRRNFPLRTALHELDIPPQMGEQICVAWVCNWPHLVSPQLFSSMTDDEFSEHSCGGREWRNPSTLKSPSLSFILILSTLLSRGPRDTGVRQLWPVEGQDMALVEVQPPSAPFFTPGAAFWTLKSHRRESFFPLGMFFHSLNGQALPGRQKVTLSNAMDGSGCIASGPFIPDFKVAGEALVDVIL